MLREICLKFVLGAETAHPGKIPEKILPTSTSYSPASTKSTWEKSANFAERRRKKSGNYDLKMNPKVTVKHRLKVPKREIFDRSDFPDYYTIKSLRVGDFGVKIKKILKNI